MILVTGASGLVGSHLIQQLVAQKKQVRALYHNSPPSLEEFGEAVEWFKADILDVVTLEEAMQNITQVYHCAAIVSFNPSQKKQIHHTNIQGTANVVNACLQNNIDKLVFVSSVAALGRIREDKPIDETMNWTEETSNSEYGKSKYLAEMEVWRGIGEGLNAVIVNPVIILGAGDWHKGSTEIFKTAYNEFPWFTEGTTGFVDAQDVAKAMILLMNSNISAERFILSAETISYKNIFTLIANAFHKKPPHKKVTPFLASIVWRWEAIKGKFTGIAPLLTKETAKTAQTKASFDNNKLKEFLPQFQYTASVDTVNRICKELTKKYQL
ncbi:MAG: NAD-dependent epimerase/dehydratase family protein [Chitinophagaceae bacterium]|nr:NAD-dependent epimerase/dehydratase family protein [Chitinophagaceae bacterium]MCW5905524.1 NAD-dependent epimerase/dehydratase family protein [Chitinophagaceae bacterium]